MEKEVAAVTSKGKPAGDLAGTWVSASPGKGYVQQCYPGAGPYTMYYDVLLKLVQSGNTVTGTLQLTGRNLVCNFPGTTWEEKLPERKAAFMKERSTHSVSGIVSGNAVTMQVEGHTYNLTHTADKLHGSGRWEGTAATYEGVFDLKRK